MGLAGALTGDRTPPPPPRAAGRVVSGGVTLDNGHATPNVYLLSQLQEVTESNPPP